jgi:hypothetical protein
VTRVLLRGRPDAGPVRAPVSADADQVEGLHALAGPGRGVVPEQHEAGPVPASQAGPDPPGRFSDGDDAASLGDDSWACRRRPRNFGLGAAARLRHILGVGAAQPRATGRSTRSAGRTVAGGP